MRLFIAVNFDDDIVGSLVSIQDELKENGVRGKYTSSENLHLTLAFVGEYDDPGKVLEVVREVPFRPMRIKYEGLQLFRDMYFVRFENHPGLMSYVRRLRRAFDENGIPYDRKRFMPHITLVRKVDHRNESPETGLDGVLNDIYVDRIFLMRSELTRNGPIYTELGSNG
ncbi:MAG: RNA 2',3'-cyclic phosphodiesterase [Lachnospiraceae bacterium]|nr:RNA 2',3'-cyclic phosphodiesterase [Lachnospiraceae bacterium]